jgi:hypothetical protein
MANFLAVAALAVFVLGAIMTVLVVATWAIRREDRKLTLTSKAPNRESRRPRYEEITESPRAFPSASAIRGGVLLGEQAPSAPPLAQDAAFYDDVRRAVGRGAPTLLLGTSTKSLERSFAKLKSVEESTRSSHPEAVGSFTAAATKAATFEPAHPTAAEVADQLTESPRRSQRLHLMRGRWSRGTSISELPAGAARATRSGGHRSPATSDLLQQPSPADLALAEWITWPGEADGLWDRLIVKPKVAVHTSPGRFTWVNACFCRRRVNTGSGSDPYFVTVTSPCGGMCLVYRSGLL